MMKRFLCCLLALCALLGCAAAEKTTTVAAIPPKVVDRIGAPDAWPDFALSTDGPLLEVFFPMIRDTDAALVRFGDETLLIDCTSAHQASRVTAMLALLGVTELDAVVNTHPHYDHTEGLASIASAVKVDEFRICFNEATNSNMELAMQVCREKNIPVTHYRDEDVMQIGGAELRTWLKGDADWTLNEASAQMKLTYGDCTMLFTADMMLKTQTRLMEVIPPEELAVDILKYPHHGLNKMNDAFLDLLSPSLAIITNNGTRSTGANYTLGRHHIPSVLTVSGYVCLTSDGTNWLCEQLTAEQVAARFQK